DHCQPGRLGLGLGAFSLPCGAAGDRAVGLWLRAAPRGRCRLHRRDRQCHAQADALGPADDRGRPLLCTRPLDRGGRCRHRHRGIAAAEAAHGLPIWSILVFPALFTAGMSLIDATDGILMLGAYGWAFIDPARKLYYNLTITGLSVAVALLVGGVEAFGLVSDRLGLAGGAWDMVGNLAADIGLLGYVIIAIFVASWLVSWLISRLAGQRGELVVPDLASATKQPAERQQAAQPQAAKSRPTDRVDPDGRRQRRPGEPQRERQHAEDDA